MCTAISYQPNAAMHLFGRNLDLDYHYQENVVITPRNFPLPFRLEQKMSHHYAMIGMATIVDNYPLYYDATNECGLSIAALNFPGNAKYQKVSTLRKNIAPFEFIPWILGQCCCVAEATTLLNTLQVVQLAFDQQYALTPLHWIISDSNYSVTVEPLDACLRIYENPVGVLTNSPPFDFHMWNLANYMNITCATPQNRFSNMIDLKPYSLGMGAIGLPGDFSSTSRFIRASFVKLNAIKEENAHHSISQFFHILDAVSQINGCTQTEKGYEKTIYTSCCDTRRGIYYYTTYNNRQIVGIDMHKVDLTTQYLYAFPLEDRQRIIILNEFPQ